MNARAWCFVQNGPCERTCYGSQCKHVADILPLPSIDDPVIPQPRRMDGTPFQLPPQYDGDRVVPHGFPVGVMIVLCTVTMAGVLGYVIGRALQCLP